MKKKSHHQRLLPVSSPFQQHPCRFATLKVAVPRSNVATGESGTPVPFFFLSSFLGSTPDFARFQRLSPPPRSESMQSRSISPRFKRRPRRLVALVALYRERVDPKFHRAVSAVHGTAIASASERKGRNEPRGYPLKAILRAV